jgi:hypothetical protein
MSVITVTELIVIVCPIYLTIMGDEQHNLDKVNLRKERTTTDVCKSVLY